MEAAKFSFSGITGAFPLIIFAYMYQPNVPMIYNELERRNEAQMTCILSAGSAVAVLFYLMVGIFGYATLSDPAYLGQLCDKNILEAKSLAQMTPIKVGNFAILLSVFAAAPLCVLPTKDCLEELIYKPNKMSSGQNLCITFSVCLVAGALGVAIPDIGSAMTIVGTTINPIVGFIIPVVLYWPQIKYQSAFGC